MLSIVLVYRWLLDMLKFFKNKFFGEGNYLVLFYK